MSEFQGAARGHDDRAPEREAFDPVAIDVAKLRVVGVEIVSDAICPWCYIGKKRFEKAVAKLPEGVTVSVRWRPFELNPHMPPEGMDRVDYRRRKFGSWEYARKLDAGVAAVGAQEGIGFRHDLIKRTPNTFEAHRLVWLAKREGVQDAFVEGRDIGDPAVLAELAAGAGIVPARAEAFLAGDEGAEAVFQALRAAQEDDVPACRPSSSTAKQSSRARSVLI